MYSIKKIYEMEEKYQDKKQELEEFKKQVIQFNDRIDINELSTFKHSEVKELYSKIRFLCSSNTSEKIKSIIQTKKLEEYPEILGVHYYPIINSIEFLDEESKIKLDTLLKKACSIVSYREQLKDLDDKIIEFLMNNKIIEKQYIFRCNCGGFDCDDKIVSEEKFNKLKLYWEKELKDETTHEEDREMNYGCFETGCWNDGSIEICSLEDFEDNLNEVRYIVKVKPDLTLDNI